VGTVAVIELSEPTLYAALTPLKPTDVAPVNPEPLITTVVPGGPLVGPNEAIVGPMVAAPPVQLPRPLQRS